MKKPDQRRRPTAFAVDDLNLLSPDERPAARASTPSLVEEADPFAAGAARCRAAHDAADAAGAGRASSSPRSAASSRSPSASPIDNLIRDLFTRTDWLGWLAVVLTALAALALVALAIREIVGLARLRLHRPHPRARRRRRRRRRPRQGARRLARADRRSMRRGPRRRAAAPALSSHIGEIIDGRDLIGLAETELLVALDEAARTMVLSSAKRVALLTAVSPRALVDLLFVAGEILRLIRRLAALYGGRPGFLGFVRLTRAAITHLAVTGGMAAGDSIVQQFLGHGIAARLSARLGEGVVNGLLTARIGIAAIEVCRPLPFVSRPPAAPLRRHERARPARRQGRDKPQS